MGRLDRREYGNSFPEPLTYEQLTAKCTRYYAELEALTTLKVENTSVIKDRKAKLLDLIDQNLDVQSMWWPTVEAEEKPKKVYSELMGDFVSHPDLTLEQLAERHHSSTTTISIKLTNEIRKEWAVKC